MTKSKSAGLDKDINNFIAKRLLAVRKHYCMTQRDIGKKLNVSIQQIQKYERCTNRIPAAKIFLVAQTLNLPISFFFPHEEHTMQDMEYLKQMFTLHSNKEKIEFLAFAIDNLAASAAK